MNHELIIIAVVVGAISAAILLTKFELLAEVISSILKAILQFAWLILSAVFEIVKTILEVCVKVACKIYEIFFAPKPQPPNENDETK